MGSLPGTALHGPSLLRIQSRGRSTGGANHFYKSGSDIADIVKKQYNKLVYFAEICSLSRKRGR